MSFLAVLSIVKCAIILIYQGFNRFFNPPLFRLMNQATPSQRLQALTMIASGCSQKEVAQAVGISTKTVRRWLRDPRFQADLQQRYRDQQIAVKEAFEEFDRSYVEDYLNASQKLCKGYLDTIIKLQPKLTQAIEKINPDELSPLQAIRALSQLADASNKILDHWSKLNGLAQYAEEAKKLESQLQETDFYTPQANRNHSATLLPTDFTES